MAPKQEQTADDITDAEVRLFKTTLLARRFPGMRDMQDADVKQIILADRKATGKKLTVQQKRYPKTNYEIPPTARDSLPQGLTINFTPVNPSQAKHEVARPWSESFNTLESPYELDHAAHLRDKKSDESKRTGPSGFVPTCPSEAKKTIEVDAFLNGGDSELKKSEIDTMKQKGTKHREEYDGPLASHGHSTASDLPRQGASAGLRGKLSSPLSPLSIDMKSAMVMRPCNRAPFQTKLVEASRPSVSRVASKRATRGCRVVAAALSDEEKQLVEEERALKLRVEITRRIKRLGDQNQPKEAIKELANLAQLGVEPDMLAATALVKACSRNMDMAQSVFDELFGELLTPDEVSFAVLLTGYGNKQPPDWPQIDATLGSMRRDHGIEPTAMSFNCLLQVCSRTNDLARGQDIIDRMEADGVDPDDLTADILAKRKVLRSYLRKVFG
eukprot:gene4630-14822_t